MIFRESRRNHVSSCTFLMDVFCLNLNTSSIKFSFLMRTHTTKMGFNLFEENKKRKDAIHKHVLQPTLNTFIKLIEKWHGVHTNKEKSIIQIHKITRVRCIFLCNRNGYASVEMIEGMGGRLFRDAETYWIKLIDELKSYAIIQIQPTFIKWLDLSKTFTIVKHFCRSRKHIRIQYNQFSTYFVLTF